MNVVVGFGQAHEDQRVTASSVSMVLQFTHIALHTNGTSDQQLVCTFAISVTTLHVSTQNICSLERKLKTWQI